MPKLILAGRNEAKLAGIAGAANVENCTTDLGAARADDAYPVIFDAAATHLRLPLLRLAIAPGFRKLAKLVAGGFFGRIVNFRLDFGWWVFDGLEAPADRPSWNYQKSGGGGLFADMYAHWRYVVESMMGPMARIVTAGWTAQPKRADEADHAFDVDVEDSCSVIVELECGTFGTITSSWAQRVIGDDPVHFQIDGTKGSAMAGMRRCRAQAAGSTPDNRGFNLVGDAGIMDFRVDHAANWDEVPEAGTYINLYRVGWEQFIRHVAVDAPLKSDYAAGIRDVQFAEACLQSSETDAWVSMAPLG